MPVFSALVEAYPQALLEEITQDIVTLSLSGEPPVRKVESWCPYSRAVSSSESVSTNIKSVCWVY